MLSPDVLIMRDEMHQPKYSVFVVDPPWAYGSNTGRPNRVAEAHYSTIGNKGKEINRNSGDGISEIIACAPIGDLAANDSHLYLWTTNPKLPFAFPVMKAWGFTYKTTLTWVKTSKADTPHGGGMGWFYRGATEHVLFGVKGNKPIPAALREPNVIEAVEGYAFGARPTGHSVKPDAFYTILDGIYDADDTKIDMFARRARPGWTAWGDEAPAI